MSKIEIDSDTRETIDSMIQAFADTFNGMDEIPPLAEILEEAFLCGMEFGANRQAMTIYSAIKVVQKQKAGKFRREKAFKLN